MENNVDDEGEKDAQGKELVPGLTFGQAGEFLTAYTVALQTLAAANSMGGLTESLVASIQTLTTVLDLATSPALSAKDRRYAESRLPMALSTLGMAMVAASGMANTATLGVLADDASHAYLQVIEKVGGEKVFNSLCTFHVRPGSEKDQVRIGVKLSPLGMISAEHAKSDIVKLIKGKPADGNSEVN
jgi:hypothetical protein